MNRKLNILIVTESSIPGGAETVVLDLARNLDRDRFNVWVVLFRPGWLFDQLKKDRLDVRVIASTRSFDLGFIFRLRRFCKENRIDLINSHLPGANMYCSMIGKLAGLPVITTAHNELIMPGYEERFDAIKKFLTRRLAAKHVLVAEYMKDQYITEGNYSVDTIETIRNGIHFRPRPDNQKLRSLRQELNLNEADILIGNVANFDPPKGQHHLIEAALLVCKKNPNAKFLLIGDEREGEIADPLKERVASLGLTDRILFLGFRTDVPDLLYLLDIFVLPSISEGLPLSIIEAKAAAKPIVATDVGGVSEVVTDGQNGYLVPPGDESSLAERLIKLAENADLRQTMGTNGYDEARAMFSMETMIGKYQDLFVRMIEKT